MTAAGQDLDALTRAAAQPGFRAVPLGLRASINIDNQIRRFASRNVIGVLPGRTRPDEYVLYTAHWDHLGACTETGEDRICNGAVDNASGTSALVALAEAHARAGRPDRTLVFLAVTAEESGLLGSAYYAANPIYPLAQTAGGFNMDSLNLAGAARDFVSIGGGKSELDAYLARAAAAAGRAGLGRADARGRLLFPLRPVQPRQDGRADALRPRRRGSGRRRAGRGPRRRARIIAPTAITASTTNMIPIGIGPARSTTSASITGSAASWRRRANGRTGSPATNSAPSATARAASGGSGAMTPRQPPEWAPHACGLDRLSEPWRACGRRI